MSFVSKLVKSMYIIGVAVAALAFGQWFMLKTGSLVRGMLIGLLAVLAGTLIYIAADILKGIIDWYRSEYRPKKS